MLTGIDVPVNRFIDTLNQKLWTNIDTMYYGVAHRNYRRGAKDIVAEVHIKGTNDYKELHFDDRYDAISFIDIYNVIDNVDFKDQTTRDGRIIFAVNLKKAYPSETGRPEELAHKNSLDMFKMNKGIVPNRIYTGVEAYGDLYTNNLKPYNMHPWHVFAIDATFKFNYDCLK